jgi:hypothetical protein
MCMGECVLVYGCLSMCMDVLPLYCMGECLGVWVVSKSKGGSV